MPYPTIFSFLGGIVHVRLFTHYLWLRMVKALVSMQYVWIEIKKTYKLQFPIAELSNSYNLFFQEGFSLFYQNKEADNILK